MLYQIRHPTATIPTSLKPNKSSYVSSDSCPVILLSNIQGLKQGGREMSNERARSPRVEFDLRLSPPRTANSSLVNPSSESLCLYSSDPDSRVSSEANKEIRSMLLVGCLRCLMYVLFSKDDPNPKCPRCKSTVLLDFLNDNKQNTNKTT
ncbi:hypothetical protein JHK87_034266 [Glycine soja]|nr:hypothetical protein JHK87_034266 [Glycine soja]